MNRKHFIREMDLHTHRQVRTFEIIAPSLASAFKQMCHDNWQTFFKHPKRAMYIRRSTCGRYQQTIRQFPIKED